MISIEKMTSGDLPEVLAIENVSFPKPFSENLFRMELNLKVAHLFVVRNGGQVVGYIDYWCIEKEMHLITLAVHPEWRQKGIGSALVEFMIQEAKKGGVEHISLDVRPSNAPALKLYGKFGFKESGRRKAYYQDNQEDALVLSLQVPAK